jgi:membrane protease YdiL (CAAX protease family)
VPLIGFGLATGYLARQRGSVLPCMVVHALFNAVSVGLLLLARPESTPLG